MTAEAAHAGFCLDVDPVTKLVAVALGDGHTGGGDDPREVLLTHNTVNHVAAKCSVTPEFVEHAIYRLLQQGVFEELDPSETPGPPAYRVLRWRTF